MKPDITMDEIVEGMARRFMTGSPNPRKRAPVAVGYFLTTANITPEQLIALAKGEAVVVPREPTEEMARAGIDYRLSKHISQSTWVDDTSAIYRAMLAAAEKEKGG